jgi:hypothetical protein
MLWALVAHSILLANARESILLQETVVPIKSPEFPLYSIGDIAVNSKREFIITDHLGNQCLMFDKEGNFLKILGKEGRGPGEFKIPVGVEVDEHDSIYVSDIGTRRISIFSPEGKFADSFIPTGYHMQADDAKIGPYGLLYLNAFMCASLNPAIPEGSCIQVYSRNGKYLDSFFPPSDRSTDLIFEPPADFGIYGNFIIGIQMGDYKIWKYGLTGRLVNIFGKVPPYFVPPKQKRPLGAPREEIDKWRHSWTRVKKICVSPSSGLVFLQLEMNDLVKDIKKKYVVDIYDVDGNLIESKIETDYRLLCTDRNDFVYFLDAEEMEELPVYRIVRYKIQIEKN